jgi:hypothetical protein
MDFKKIVRLQPRILYYILFWNVGKYHFWKHTLEVESAIWLQTNQHSSCPAPRKSRSNYHPKGKHYLRPYVEEIES